MSLILTSQDNQVNSRPFNYQNYFSSTYKIEKDSLIALNHVTVNRNAYFNFDEDKVLAFYHGIEMSGKVNTFLREKTNSSGNKYKLLLKQTASISSRTMNNFVNYPMFVRIEKGEYDLTRLCETLTTRLNSPSGQYGGDWHVTGQWNVVPVYDTNNEFTHIRVEWNTKDREITGEYPTSDDVVFNYPDNKSITYTDDGSGNKEITSTDAETNVIEFNRFISHAGGTIKFFMPTSNINGIAVGLTRCTGGSRFQEFNQTEYVESDLDRDLDIDKKLAMFDICVGAVNNTYHVYYLHCEYDDKKANKPYTYEMREYTYGTPVQHYMSDNIEFEVSGNNIKIVITGQTTKTIDLVLPPTNNNTYQLIPKVLIDGVTTTVKFNKTDYPDLLPDTIVPIIPASSSYDLSNCNIGWIVENAWYDIGEENGENWNFNNSYLANNFNKFHTWHPSDADVDSTTVFTRGQTLSIAEAIATKQWWSYDFDPSLNSNAGGFKYSYIKKDASNDFIYKQLGTVLIPYMCKHIFYHCGATIDGALGIPPRYKKGSATVTVGGLTIVTIEGSSNVALTTNDLLYIRIDLGNTYTMNGHTSMVSKIISPIITQTTDRAFGIRTYTPERMYLKLNNTEDLYINSINVSIVTKNEAFARDLAPTTSASFHIIKNNNK